MSYLAFLFRKTQMEPIKFNFKIRQGTTFSETFRWESSKKSYAKVLSISNTAPLVITTQTPHGMPPGWRFKLSGVAGMKEVNTSTDTWHVSDPDAFGIDIVTVNNINAIGFAQHTASTGVLEYQAPAVLTTYVALMQIRSKVDSTEVLLELTTENGMLVVAQSTSSITINIPSSVTKELSFNSAVYSLELKEESTGIIIPLMTGSILVIKDSTTWAP